jgi:high-affinity iron transporter
MLPTFVIGLREGVEASLIVGIVAAFLAGEGRRDALRWVWAGVGAAVALCLAVGVALQIVDAELPQRQQEGLETVIGLLAVVVVTSMIVWMRRHARDLAGELRASAGAALARGSVGALVGMAFFAVVREGMETVVFLLAAFQSATEPTTAGIGALLGVLVAAGIGLAIYRGGVRLNLGRFFRFTGVVLVFVAAGVLANALHSAHEAGWIGFGQRQAVDLSWLVVPGTWTASLLTGMLGLQPRPTVIEAVAYVAYAVPVLAYVLWPARRRMRPVPAGAAGSAAAAVAAIVLVACGGSSSAGAGADAQGARKVAVRLTDAGCSPARIELDAGPTVFAVTNAGTSRVSEFEVLDGTRILGEKENLVSGLSGEFRLDLRPGRYSIACPGGTTAATGVLHVGGRR